MWRFRADIETTLENVLASLDMKAVKEREGVYKLKDFEYHRWNVDEAWEYLDWLSERYDDKRSWEQRKSLLKPQIYEAMRLSPLPPKPSSLPIITAKRKMNGYTVENIAIEILPGLYVNGSLYKPAKIKGQIPVILSPDGHWAGHRYREDSQIRCGMIARMGGMAFSYDLFAWGESLLQFDSEDHRRSLALTLQTLAGIRILDYLISLKETDPSRVGISGGSGGGNHTALLTALDDRIKLSAPVVSLSSYHFGGCPCESGMPIHSCGGGTNNVEIAAMAAPRPQLIVSDGKDWTAHAPEKDIPYLKNIYGYYDKGEMIENVHLPKEGHDFGISKRKALYDFLVKHFGMNENVLTNKHGLLDESAVVIEEEKELYVFGSNGEKLPENAIMGFEALEKVFAEIQGDNSLF
jgi:hypothetical protein